MLRLISVIGIAIAMVIGFVALSTKMKDDYSVRSRVVSVFKQMKTLAADELQCQSKQQPTEDQTQKNLENSNRASMEMDADVNLTPLSEEQASVGSEMHSTEENPVNSETDDNTEEASIQLTDTTENVEVENNADIIKTMGYRTLDTGSIEVITIFNAIKGESGKAQITADSRVVINCQCDSDKMYCKTVESNINKNYLPKMLSKQ